MRDTTHEEEEMDQLENQVSDLRYLTQNAITPLAETPAFTPQSAVSPGSAAGHNSALHQHQHYHQHQNQASSAGNYHETGSNDGKRKSVDGSPNSAKQPRSKRNRYISIACNECKRRKIKCNGETPCQRCGNLNLQCLYAPNCCSNNVKDSEEFREMASTVSRLQEQVETLFNNLNSLRSETLRLAPLQDRIPPVPSGASEGTPSSSASVPIINRPDFPHLRQPGFRGPTSTHFSLDVAKKTLHKMGYSSLDVDAPEDRAIAQEGTPTASPMPGPLTQEAHQGLPQDPLWDFDKAEMIRLCRVYEEEVGIMYPVVRIDTIVSHVHLLTSWMDAIKKNFLLQPFGHEGGIKDMKSLQLKMVMCNALIVEEHGDSERAARLLESVRPILDRMLMSDASDVANLPLLALLAGYRFLSNDEILAWRVIGQAARHCIELGLHRRDAVLRIADEEERRNAIHTFWSAYVLDRRWSFGTGLPYIVAEEEIDPNLPYPDHHPYLIAMISYSQLSTRVWRLVRQFEPNMALDLRQGDIEDLDRQIKQWYTGVPPEVQLELPDWESMPPHLNPPVGSLQEYNIQRLQIWTYLRLNQIRIWLHIPILHTHSSIMEHMRSAERVVKLAKNTIKYLSHLNNTTDLYRKIQVFYNQFLISAIAVLFLASCHAPVNFSSSCRDEFYMALELVKDLSSKSWVSKRLWRTIKSLKKVAPRLGLAETEDLHSSAALTMAGLATGHMSSTPPTSTAPSFGRPVLVSGAATPAVVDTAALNAQNGWQISTEMSRIFEGYTGLPPSHEDAEPARADSIQRGDLDLPSHHSDHEDGGSSPTVMFGVKLSAPAPGSVYSHFRDMF